MLTNVNQQRNELSYLLMFAFLLFGGIKFCWFLQISCPPVVPRSHFCPSRTGVLDLIISYLYLQMISSASESDFLQRKAYYMQIWLVNRMISSILTDNYNGGNNEEGYQRDISAYYLQTQPRQWINMFHSIFLPIIKKTGAKIRKIIENSPYCHPKTLTPWLL